MKKGDRIKVFTRKDAHWRDGKIFQIAKNRYIGVTYFDGSKKYIPWDAAWKLL